MSADDSDPKTMMLEYFERDLSDEETDALFEALNGSAELRDSFMTAARDEWLLNHTLHMRKAASRPVVIPHLFRRRIRRAAALITVVLTLAGIYTAHRIRVNPTASSVRLQLQPVARVVDFYVMENDAVTLVNHGTVRELNKDTRLNAGDRIVVPPGARLTFRYMGEMTTVAVEGNTLLSVDDDQGGKVIRLNRGRLEATVDKQDPGAPMRVITDDAEAVVLGTQFEISAAEYTRLAVHSGCVRLTSFLHKKSVDVSAGHLVSSRDMTEQGNVAFDQIELIPLYAGTLNNPVNDYYLIVDDDREYSVFLAFDIGTVSDRIIEARLQLTVAKSFRDPGGEGVFRLHRVSPSADPGLPSSFGTKTQVAYVQGRVDYDLQLEMDLKPELLNDGINNLVLSLDEGGNDCWFAPKNSGAPPRLFLKIRKD